MTYLYGLLVLTKRLDDPEGIDATGAGSTNTVSGIVPRNFEAVVAAMYPGLLTCWVL